MAYHLSGRHGEPHLAALDRSQPADTVYAANAVTGAEVWHFKTANGGDNDIGSGLTISAWASMASLMASPAA
jgi:hypothetical protein